MLGLGVPFQYMKQDLLSVVKAAQTLNSIAPERIFLTPETGESLVDLGADDDWTSDGGDHQCILKEALDLARELFTGRPITYLGRYYQVRQMKIASSGSPLPVHLPTLFPGSAYFAGFYGDGLVTVGGKPPQYYQRMLQQFERGARKAGKNPDDLPRMVELKVALRSENIKTLKEKHPYQKTQADPIYSRFGAAKDILYDKSLIHDPLHPLILSDDPETHTCFLQQYADLGFTHLIVQSDEPDQKAFIARYGRLVLSRLNQHTALDDEMTERPAINVSVR